MIYLTKPVAEFSRSVSVTHKKDKSHLIFLNTSDIERGQYLHRNYSEVQAWPGQAKKSVQKGDILFSEIRPGNGRWAFVDFDADDYVVSTKLMVLRVDRKFILPKFFYLWITSPSIVDRLQSLAESRSGTFPQITFDDLAFLDCPLPTIHIQQEIVEAVEALDDKIEVNRRMSATLEDMARSMYRSWFVDFDPVNAKMEGRQPAFMDEATAALFPYRFGDDGLPEGWILTTIGEVAEIVGGATPKSNEPEFWDEGHHLWATPKDLSNLGQPILLDTARKITDAGLSPCVSVVVRRSTFPLFLRWAG